MGQLRLEVRDFAGVLRWRWLLSDEGSGAPLADHQVDLAGEPGEFAAFTDLYRYLRWNAAPDRRTASETDIAGAGGSVGGRGRAGPGGVRGDRGGGAGDGAGSGPGAGRVRTVVAAGVGSCGRSAAGRAG